MMIDPLHSGPTCNGYNNGDHAGTLSPPLPTRLGWKVAKPDKSSSRTSHGRLPRSGAVVMEIRRLACRAAEILLGTWACAPNIARIPLPPNQRAERARRYPEFQFPRGVARRHSTTCRK